MSGENNSALVQCLVCQRHFKTLPVHLKAAHSMSVIQYRGEFGPKVNLGHVLSGDEGMKKARETKLANGGEIGGPAVDAAIKLTKDEEEYFKTRYSSLSRETGYDPTVEYVIRQVVQTEITVDRYQRLIQEMTSSPKKIQMNVESLKEIVAVIEKLNKQHIALMDKLSLSREQRMKARKQIETTPSRMITAFESERERLTKEERQIAMEDDADALRRFWHNNAALLNLIPQSASGEEEATDDDILIPDEVEGAEPS